MRVVGVGQRGARHPTVKTHMVEFAAQRPQARFYVAKAIPVSELGKGHRQILIPTREASRSPPYRATQRRNSRSGRKLSNWENTVRPWFMNHCRTPQSWSLEPVAVQIAARQISSQTADGQGLIRLCKVLYRTLVKQNQQLTLRTYRACPILETDGN